LRGTVTRHEEIARRNAERLKHLRTSGDLLRQAEDLYSQTGLKRTSSASTGARE